MSNNILEMEKLNNSLNEIVKNYLYFSNKIAIKKKYIDDDEILNNEIKYLQISMFDLVIQLQNLNFKLDNIDDESITSNSDIEFKTNKLLDKTINDMLPLFMLALMNNDKDSILNSNIFMNNIKETINSLSNQVSNLTIPTPSAQTPSAQTPSAHQHHTYAYCVDDLD